MSATSKAEELRRLKAWQDAYQRTDLVARLGFATLADYRNQGALNLPEPINSQLDRFEQAKALEETAHQDWENSRGAA